MANLSEKVHLAIEFGIFDFVFFNHRSAYKLEQRTSKKSCNSTWKPVEKKMTLAVLKLVLHSTGFTYCLQVSSLKLFSVIFLVIILIILIFVLHKLDMCNRSKELFHVYFL